MMCLVQIALLICGIGIMRKKEIRLGSQVIDGAYPFFVGLPLVVQLPVGFTIAFLIGMNAGFEAAQDAQKYQLSESQAQVAVQKKVADIQARFWWIDVIVPVCGVLASGLLLSIGLRDPDAPPTSDGYIGGTDDVYQAKSDEELFDRLRQISRNPRDDRYP